MPIETEYLDWLAAQRGWTRAEARTYCDKMDRRTLISAHHFAGEPFGLERPQKPRRTAVRARNPVVRRVEPATLPATPTGSSASGLRVAIYVRVSKDNSIQDPENQLMPLRRWCADHRHTVVAEYVDYASGKNTTGRPRFIALFDAAARGEFDLALCWSLDRWSREGMVTTVFHLQRLSDAGVAFRSLQEPGLATEDEMVRNILLACWSSLAKAERLRISERTKAGLDRVRRNGSRSGKAIGRPSLPADKLAIITRLAGDGADKFTIAKAAGCHWKTVAKYMNGAQPHAGPLAGFAGGFAHA